MIVLDASAVLELLLGTDRGSRVAERIARPEETLHVPHLLDLEVARVLRRYVSRGELHEARAGEALDDLRDLDLNRYSHDVFLDRIWELRHNVSAYDASYLALAEALGARLLTADTHLAEIPGARVRVELL